MEEAASRDRNDSLDEQTLASLVVRVERARSSLDPRKEVNEPPVPIRRSSSEREVPSTPLKKSPSTKPPRPPQREDSNSVGSFTAAYFPESATKTETKVVPEMYFPDSENPPPTDMAFVGIPDDVSTIANDTIGGSVGSRFNFFRKGAITPDRHGRRPNSEESPPGFNGTVQIPSPKDGDLPSRTRSNGRKYTYAAILAVFLLGAIGALSYGLIRVRDINSVVAPGTTPGDWSWTYKPTLAPTGRPTTDSPTEFGATRAPTARPTSGRPTRSPTAEPTTSGPTPATPAPTDTAFEDLKQVLGQESASIVAAVETSGSPQQQAFEWLANDPDYFTYDKRKVVQRWTLAMFSLSIATTRRRLSDRQLNEALDTWMQYTDECTWFTSWYENRVACDRDGIFKFLVLRNVGLDGTIPTELALLSKLDTLILSDNNLVGTVPETIGAWTVMENFEIASNRIRGTLPASIRNMESLVVLDVGDNRLEGQIPNIGNLGRLATIKMNSNALVGQIPNNFQDLVNLSTLDLSNNLLTGGIPQINRLNLLSELKLSQTSLSGAMPADLCAFGLDVLEADCDEVYCSCCTNCRSRGTSAPTPVPVPTGFPTKLPTLSPTMTPSLATAAPIGRTPPPTGAPVTGSPTMVTGSPTATTPRPTARITPGPTARATPAPSVRPTPGPTASTESPTAKTPPPTRRTPEPTAKTANPTAATSNPTRATTSPTKTPTARPNTSAPTPPECVDTVRVTKSCFEYGEPITVEFNNCFPVGSDWIGIYDSGQFAYQLYQPMLQLRNCGTTNCFEGVSAGSLSFQDGSQDSAPWPIFASTYKAWMFRRGPQGGPYFGYAVSEVFTVVSSSGSCP